MPAESTWRQHRVRWLLLALAAVLLGVLAAFAIHVLALLQPARFTRLLEQQLAHAGVTLELQAPARPALFPRPAVHVQRFSLANAGSATPILTADSATIVVPWRAVLHGDVAIERVDVDSPRVDLGQLRQLLARLPESQGPPDLPTILTGVHFSQGTVASGSTPILFEVDLATGELVAGQPFRMNFAARGADGTPISANLALVPSRTGGAIAFDAVDLSLQKQRGIRLALKGRGEWQGGDGITLNLAGTLGYPALAALPAPARTAARASAPAPTPAPEAMTTNKVSIAIEPPRGQAPLSIAIAISGADANADLTLQPTEFAGWWQRLLAASPGHPPGPLPVTGKAAASHLDLGWLQATGITVDAEATPAPAATSAPAPSGQR